MTRRFLTLFLIIINLIPLHSIDYLFGKSIHVCDDENCLLNTIQYYSLTPSIYPIFWVSDGYLSDQYAMLYFGWITYLFSSSKCYMLVLNMKNNPDAVHIINSILPKLPSKTAFITLMHGTVTPTPGLYHSYTSIANNTSILIHLNHEQPWNQVPSQMSDQISTSKINPADTKFGDNKQLLYEYSKYTIVLRNYYYKPFDLPNIIYLPLGPAYYGNGLGTRWPHDDTTDLAHLTDISDFTGTKCDQIQQLPQYNTHPNTPILQRTQLCTLAGRFTYPYHSIFHSDRRHIQALMNNITFLCDVYTGPSGGLSREAYLTLLNNTVFAPCPAGTSP